MRGRRFDVEVAGRQAVVREARASDAKACLAALVNVVREKPRTLLVAEDEIWGPKVWRENRLPWGTNGVWLIAELDGDLVGMLTILRGHRRSERHKGEFGVWLVERARGLGLGAALLRVAEIWASEHQVSRIELTVFAGNQRAIRLYESAGYQHEGTARNAYLLPEGDLVDAMRMAKLL